MQGKRCSAKKIVCCVDILGFSPKFTGLSGDKKVIEYSQIIEALKSACHRILDYRTEPPEFSLKRTNFYWFSDTFILFSNDFSFEDPSDVTEDLIKEFFHSVKMLFLRFLYYGFPLRGGIDYGEFIVDPVLNIYIGEALIRAYKNSEEHEWAGISITSDFSKLISDYGQLQGLLIDYEVPIRKNLNQVLKVIDWPNDQTIKQKQNPEEYIHRQFQKFCKPLDDKAQQYLKNTIAFLRDRLNSVGSRNISFQL